MERGPGGEVHECNYISPNFLPQIYADKRRINSGVLLLEKASSI
jgi:hypothetical protein